MSAMTTPIWSNSNKPYGECSLPVYDDLRIWALWTGGARTAPTIEYSDDYGDTWNVWASIPNDSAAPLGNANTLIRDRAGNCYYNCQTGAAPGVRGLGRIDAVTKAVTKCFDYHVTGPQAAPAAWDVAAHPWSWTADDDGAIFVGQYVISYWNGSAWVDGGLNGFKGQYIWRSLDNGLTWTRLDYFVVGARPDVLNTRHIHSIHANPYDGALWVNVGDIPKVTFYSLDKGATWVEVYRDDTAHEVDEGVWEYGYAELGCTGLTFTPERTYLGDDLTTNTKIWRTTAGRSPVTVSFSPDLKRQAPMYYLRAAGSDELWFTTVNDGAYSWARSSLVKLTKAPGTTDGWTQEVIVESPTSSNSTSNYPYSIAHDGQGIIPADHPYVFYTVMGATAQGAERGVYRIQRAPFPPERHSLTFDLFSVAEALAGDGAVTLAASGAAGVESDEDTFDLVFGMYSQAEAIAGVGSIGISGKGAPLLALDRIGSPRRRLAVIDPFTPTRL